MTEYLVVVRVEPKRALSKGINRGDVISYRRAECATTNLIILLDDTEILGDILRETNKTIEIKDLSGKNHLLWKKRQVIKDGKFVWLDGDIKEIQHKRTSGEKKKTCAFITSMTEEEEKEFEKKIMPKKHCAIAASPDIRLNSDEVTAWFLAEKEAMATKPERGLKIDLCAMFTDKEIKELDDLTKEVDKIKTISKDVFQKVK